MLPAMTQYILAEPLPQKSMTVDISIPDSFSYQMQWNQVEDSLYSLIQIHFFSKQYYIAKQITNIKKTSAISFSPCKGNERQVLINDIFIIAAISDLEANSQPAKHTCSQVSCLDQCFPKIWAISRYTDLKSHNSTASMATDEDSGN